MNFTNCVVLFTLCYLIDPIENTPNEPDLNSVQTERVPPALKRRPTPKRFQKLDFFDLKCKTDDLITTIKLKDSNFIQAQLACILEEGPCDELGATLKSKL